MTTEKATSGIDQEVGASAPNQPQEPTLQQEGECAPFVMPTTGPDTEEERRLRDVHATHEAEKRDALERYALAFADEVTALVLPMVNAVPFVRHNLFGNDEPEGMKLPDALERLENAYAGLSQRAGMIHHQAEEMNDGPDDEPYDPKYWDKIQVQRAVTHARALSLAAEVVALAFTCDQYARAKHVWRNDALTPAAVCSEDDARE